MNCPKCSNATQLTSAGDVSLDRCTSCGGIWLDALEAERLRSLPGSDNVDIASSPASGAGPQSPSTSRVMCPRCGTRMILLMVDRKPPIYFEHCGSCRGVFLDAGELRAMKEATLDEWLRATIPGVFKLRLPPLV